MEVTRCQNLYSDYHTQQKILNTKCSKFKGINIIFNIRNKIYSTYQSNYVLTFGEEMTI